MQENMTSKELAEYFVETYDRDEIISELFAYFEFDCKTRLYVEPQKFDNEIRNFLIDESTSSEILSCIIEMIRNGIKNNPKNETDIINLTKEYIGKNIAENLKIEDIAKALHISYYYLCHLFKQQTKMSISKYRILKRMEKAVYLMMNSNNSISNIGAACGYNNVSYFTEIFAGVFGQSPTAFKKNNSQAAFHSFYSIDDIKLAEKIPFISFMNDEISPSNARMETILFQPCNDTYEFLHETAVIKYHGVLFASWYFCKKNELTGYTPICGRRSYDGGKTWSEIETLADDPTEKILYCPPVYGICDDKLYMFVNQMVAADHIHSLDLFVLDNETDHFVKLWSRPIPFKINTNVVTLPYGKLMIPGRIGQLDGFPNTPAVLISDSGKIDGEWRIVKIAENENLPFGKRLVHPEITVMNFNNTLYTFCRDDLFRVPLVYLSKDMGETWSEVHGHDIPYTSSKMYAGTLPDGRNYLIANEADGESFNRSKLVLYISSLNSLWFTERLVLMDCNNENAFSVCHYPCAFADNEKLYITATVNYRGLPKRGAILFTVEYNHN